MTTQTTNSPHHRSPKFPTVIKDPAVITATVKKDLLWVTVSCVIAIAAAAAAFQLI